MTTQTKSLEVSRIAVSAGSRILAALFLVYFAPIMIAVAVLIKMDSQGPVFLRQMRRGANGEMVALLEFRTKIDEGPVNAFDRMANETVLGAFLYETRLDMLPRLVNMLRGEVSFSNLLR